MGDGAKRPICECRREPETVPGQPGSVGDGTVTGRSATIPPGVAERRRSDAAPAKEACPVDTDRWRDCVLQVSTLPQAAGRIGIRRGAENLVLRQAQDEVFLLPGLQMVLILSLSKNEGHARP